MFRLFFSREYDKTLGFLINNFVETAQYPDLNPTEYVLGSMFQGRTNKVLFPHARPIFVTLDARYDKTGTFMQTKSRNNQEMLFFCYENVRFKQKYVYI